MAVFLRLLVGAFLCAYVLAIEVADNSKCKNVCGGGQTLSSDLICRDEQYDSTDHGRTMRNCLLCESTSPAHTTPNASDVYWFLFNQKWTIQYCLFQHTGETTAYPDCQAACIPLKTVFTSRWFHKDGSRVPIYWYCNFNDGVFGKYIEDCSSCVRKHENSVVLANFMDTLQSACEKKPNVTNGETVPMPQDLFETPAPTQTSGPSAVPSDTGGATAGGDSGSSGLSTGAQAGIGVGVGVGALIIIGAAIWFVLQRRRKGKALGQDQQEKSAHGISEASAQDRVSALPPAEVEDNMVTEGRTKAGGTWRAELPSS